MSPFAETMLIFACVMAPVGIFFWWMHYVIDLGINPASLYRAKRAVLPDFDYKVSIDKTYSGRKYRVHVSLTPARFENRERKRRYGYMNYNSSFEHKDCATAIHVAKWKVARTKTKRDAEDADLQIARAVFTDDRSLLDA